MVTDIEKAIGLKRDFCAKYGSEPWFGYAELRMTEHGYALYVYVTSVTKAENVLPFVWGEMLVFATTMRC